MMVLLFDQQMCYVVFGELDECFVVVFEVVGCVGDLGGFEEVVGDVVLMYVEVVICVDQEQFGGFGQVVVDLWVDGVYDYVFDLCVEVYEVVFQMLGLFQIDCV